MSDTVSASVPASARVIYYKVYPWDSARKFPNFTTCIFVKPDLYEQWKDDKSSVNFEDVLVDPKDPIKYVWANCSKYGYIENIPSESLRSWYLTTNTMEIAKATALKGYDRTDNFEKILTHSHY